MAWGGGHHHGGSFQNAHSHATAAGLPFAGVPEEMAARVQRILDLEPDHREPEVEFSHSRWDRRPLTLRRLLGAHTAALIAALALVVTETVAMQAGPLLTQVGIDRGVRPGNFGVLVAVALAYLGTVVLAVAAGAGRIAATGRIGEGLMYGLRVRVFSHLQRLSLDFFTEEKAGVLMSRMTSDIENLTQLFHEGLVQLVVQGLTVVVVTVFLFVLDVRLALVTLVLVVPVMTVLTVWFQRASTRGYLAVRDRIADVLADLSENLAGIRVVTAHNRRRHNVVRHRNIVGEHRDANDLTARVNALYGPGSELVGVVGQALVLLLGGRMVLTGSLTVGELTAFVLFLTQFFAPMQQLAHLYTTYQQGQASISKLRGLLAAEPDVPEAPDAHGLPSVTGEIRLAGVTFGYDPVAPVLHDVDLEVRAGETFALVGPTGAGKSTVAKLVARFYDPTEGRVLVDGHDLRTVTIESLRRQLGVVPQEPFLFHGTVRDNIAFARPDAPDDDVFEAADAVGLADLLRRLPEGLEAPVHERGVSLSAGERQLLALARAFFARPRVLILDEATSNLDPASEERIERALDVVLEGRTAIVIAHRLSTAMRADRIAVIDEGRVVEVGTHQELLAREGPYAEMIATWEQHAGRRGAPLESVYKSRGGGP